MKESVSLNYFSSRKGQIYSKNNSNKRYVVVNYDLRNLYLVNISNNFNLFKFVHKIKYKDLYKKNLKIER